MSFLQASRSREIVFAVVFSLIASLIVLLPNAATPAKASSHGITYNDQVCDLTTAGYAGDGSAGSPYQISDSDALWEITDCSITNSAPAHFELTQDIDASSATHAPTSSPIGFSTSSVIYSFSGVLDGNSKRISYSSRATSYASLFAVVQDATIEKLSVGADVESTGPYAAGLASIASGSNTVSDVMVFGKVSGGFASGGFFGQANHVNFFLANNLADVTTINTLAAGFVGDLSGIMSGRLLSNFGDITGEGQVGGVIGGGQQVILDDARNHGTISSSAGVWTGGLIGAAGVSTISNSINFGEVKGAGSGTGGLLGYSLTSTQISNGQNRGSVSGVSHTGGLVGYANGDANMETSFNTVAITGDNDTGGLVGYVNGDANIETAYNTGAITGADDTGGLVGEADNATITSSYNTGSVSGSEYVGGLVGFADFSASIDSSRNTGNVSGVTEIGGFVGYAAGNADIQTSYNTGSVSGIEYVGGFVGMVIDPTTITSSYNTGPVSGSKKVGGFVGQGININIDSSYNTGSVSGSSDLDGLVGKANGAMTAPSAYTTIASRFTTTSTVTDLRTASGYQGFDFTSNNPVWGFGTCSENNGLPMLRVFNQVATYYDTGCFTAPQQQQNTETSEPEPAPVYAGPVLDQVKVTVSTGERMVLTGSRLETVVEVSIGGIKQQIVSVTPAAIEILVSSSTSKGVQDLVLVSAFGKLTAQAAIEVSLGTVTSGEGHDVSQSGIVMSELIGKTRMLSLNASTNESWMKSNLEDSGLKRVVCTATVREGATHHQRVQARKLAKAACEQVVGYLVEPSTWFQTKETRSRFVGRVFLTVKG